MPTRNVVLTDKQEALISDLVLSGRYQNASEVLRDGLRLLEDEIARRKAELEDILAGILTGLGDAERGDLIDGETAIRDAYAAAESQVDQRR
jgi:antitoxin ParD1/3/4